MESRAKALQPFAAQRWRVAVTDRRDDVHLLRLYFTYRIQQTADGVVGASRTEFGSLVRCR